MFLIDSHCHLDRLDLSIYDGQLAGALDAAHSAGIGHMLCVCIDLEHFPDVLGIAQAYPQISASVGVHPTHQDGEEPDAARLIALANDPNIVAIGETGLDYFRCQDEDMEWQRARFREHIAASRATGKPLIIHMRDATVDTLRILREEKADEVGGVMHCFVEDWDTARAAMDLNFYISFSGIVTFRSAKTLQDVAAKMPADRYLVETDSPYLAPVPHRGKPNQPAWVSHVAEFVAQLRDESVETVTETTTRNYQALFGALD